MEASRAAFERWRIAPRVLRDVEERDLSIQLFGQRLPLPSLLAPIGVLEMVQREADLAVARAAAAMRVPYTFSNQASVPMEHCAAAMGGDLSLGQPNRLGPRRNQARCSDISTVVLAD